MKLFRGYPLSSSQLWRGCECIDPKVSEMDSLVSDLRVGAKSRRATQLHTRNGRSHRLVEPPRSISKPSLVNITF
jgi:hypothetical protein